MLVLLDVTVEHGETRSTEGLRYDGVEPARGAAHHGSRSRAPGARPPTASSRNRARFCSSRNRLERNCATQALRSATCRRRCASRLRSISGTFPGPAVTHWVSRIDSDHFALCCSTCAGASGVCAAIGRVANTLRTGALVMPSSAARRCERTRTHQMEYQDDLYFTIWYGVYEPSLRRLRYASAGHPPPIVVRGLRRPRYAGCAAGAGTGARRAARCSCRAECVLSAPAISICSATACTESKPDGKMLGCGIRKRSRSRCRCQSELDELLAFAREARRADARGRLSIVG